MPAPSSSYSMDMPVSPPPPQNLSTYSRFMHDHTKRQMESFGAYPSGRSRGSGSSTASASTTNSSLTNGVSTADYHP